MNGCRHILPLFLMVVIAVFAAGCRTPDRDPAAGIEHPQTWKGATNAADVPDDPWWQTFGDTNLNRLVAESLGANFDLRLALARVDAAMAEARIVGADLAPQVNAGFDASRVQRNFIGFPIPGSSGDVLTTRSTVYGLNLNASWELDLWGRLRSARKAALMEVEATHDEWVGARLSIAGQTVRAWLAVIEARQQLSLATQTTDSFRKTAQQVRDRYELGVRPPLDLRLALANEAGAEALVEFREINLQQAIRQLEIVLGRYPSGALETADQFPPMPGLVPAGLPADLLVRRPDLLAARHRLSAADYRLNEARVTLLPRISLTAGGGTATEELSDLLNTDFKVWTLAGNVVQPLFQGGRLLAGVDLADARVQQALAGYRGAMLRAFSEVETTLASEQRLRQREQRLEESVEQSEAALRLAELRYRVGLDNFITILESQRRLFETQTQLVSVRFLRFDNRVRLHLALGGGFDLAHEPSDSPDDSD